MLFSLHARLRVHWAPGIPCALYSRRGETILANLGRLAPRECEGMVEIGKPSLRAKRSNPSCRVMEEWIASSRSLSSGAHSRDPLAPRRSELFRRLRPCVSPILHRRMRRAKTGAPRPEQFFAQRARAVGLLVTPAPGQLRNQHLCDVLEIRGRNRKRHVQSVDVGLLEPGFDLVGNLFRRSHHHRPDAADADM